MDKTDLSMETRMLLAEQWMERHEKDCADRWRELKQLLLKGGGVALGVIIAICAWGLNKTWDAQSQQLHMLQEMQRAAVTAPR